MAWLIGFVVLFLAGVAGVQWRREATIKKRKAIYGDVLNSISEAMYSFDLESVEKGLRLLCKFHEHDDRNLEYRYQKERNEHIQLRYFNKYTILTQDVMYYQNGSKQRFIEFVIYQVTNKYCPLDAKFRLVRNYLNTKSDLILENLK